MPPKKPPVISNAEWGMIIFALFIIDLAQALLDLIAIGIALNRIIDIAVGYFLVFYTLARGLKLVKPARMGGFIVTFILEFIGVGDVLPLWCLDGVLNMWAYKKEVREYEKAMAEYNQAQTQKQQEENFANEAAAAEQKIAA